LQTWQYDEVVAFKTALEAGATPLAPIILSAKSDKYTSVSRDILTATEGNVSVPLNFATSLAGTDGRVDWMVREYGGKVYVFAARLKKRSGEMFANCTASENGYNLCTAIGGVWPDSTNTNSKIATMTVSGMAGLSTATTIGETPARILSVSNGSFSDSFTDYGVHIYEMSEGEPAISHTVSVGKAGTGRGTVYISSAYPLMTCGDTCSMDYPADTSVTITAVADAGSTFDALSGEGCSGLTCTITVDEAKLVTATFSATGKAGFIRLDPGGGDITFGSGGGDIIFP
jgi:hypothetical protein